ncbi:MAG: FecR domain-containing protein [Nitrospirota bacterium]
MTRQRFVLVLVLGLAIGLPLSAAAATECPEWSAKIVSIEGRVEALRTGDATWQAVTLNDTYCPDDRVRTLENSRAAIQLQNETIIRLDQNTTVRFSGLDPQSPTLLELIRGSAFFLSRFPRTLTIETPFVNAASGGTEFHIEVNEEDQTTTITVIEGQMNVTNESGSTVVTAGQAAVAKAGQAPVLRVVVRARDAIQWALYYPPVLSLRELRLGATEGLLETDWRAMVQRSVEAYRENDVAKAFSAIEGAPEDIADAGFYTYRASLSLSVGRVDQARADIDKALGLAPRDGLALALQSIIAVVQNEPDQALKLATEATQAAPDSVSVRIALSYAQQANFNLTEALAAAKEAVKLDPEASLAWARLAELWMGQGDLDEALDAAKKAEALNPREVRIQTVLGFAYLTQIKIDAARNAFQKAIALNSADPLPRLGLGLARIRKGDLEQGRKEIEIAATLDPNNALIRSYLGKAYYEEKRDPQAAIQLDMGKELDPMDPTPYLYDAIRKQTINRPVEALHDLQESIKLNDNRAVYRSQLLLDKDLSSRSVSQARIAEDLGFGQLALSEGWKSVNTDPTNYSAHRFLADSYAALPNSEIARQSALLQSQLLQPLNSNPIQPSLSDDSALSPGTGPANPSFNEYTQLFDRNRAQLLASGIVGNQDTWGEELVATGLYDQYSVSLGQFRYRTQGFRENADIDQQIYNGFIQVALTTKLSIQGEARVNDSNNGYLAMSFDPDLYSPTRVTDTRTETYRLGLHYSPSSKSDFIVSGVYQKSEVNLTDQTLILAPPDFGSMDASSSTGRTVEGQYLLHLARLSLIAGGGYYTEPTSAEFNAIDSSTLPPTIFASSQNTQKRHSNVYLYSLIHLPTHLTLALGGSVDRLRLDVQADFGGYELQPEQFNPKLGVTWDLTGSNTLRLAYFRTMKRTHVSDQTIEPTQVAGFQQFFQDSNDGTESAEYGVGIDQRFSSDLYGGIEYTRRDLDLPLPTFSTPPTVDYQHESIKRGRAYLYWSPHVQTTATAEYFYDKMSGDLSFFTSEVTTHRIPLGLNFHHPRGFFAKVMASYVNQDGEFIDPTTFGFEPGKSEFWIWDVSIGYRLPRRLGIITIGAENLFDRQFLYEDVGNPLTNPDQAPQIQPARFIFAKVTLAF